MVFAAGHVRNTAQVRDDAPGAILAIQAQQRPCRGKAVGRDVLLDGRFRPAQFLAILSVTRIAKAGDPLMGVHLQDGGACANDFPSFASRVAGNAEGAQPSLRGRSIRRV